MRTPLDFLADMGKPECPAAIERIGEGFLLYAELYAWGKVTVRLTGCAFHEGESLPQGALMLHRFSYRPVGAAYEASLTYSLFGEEDKKAKHLFSPARTSRPRSSFCAIRSMRAFRRPPFCANRPRCFLCSC